MTYHIKSTPPNPDDYPEHSREVYLSAYAAFDDASYMPVDHPSYGALMAANFMFSYKIIEELACLQWENAPLNKADNSPIPAVALEFADRQEAEFAAIAVMRVALEMDGQKSIHDHSVVECIGNTVHLSGDYIAWMSEISGKTEQIKEGIAYYSKFAAPPSPEEIKAYEASEKGKKHDHEIPPRWQTMEIAGKPVFGEASTSAIQFFQQQLDKLLNRTSQEDDRGDTTRNK